MKSTLDINSFWKAYLAVFLSFVTSSLLLQTDMLFIAPLGADSTAAFVVPSKLMIIDAIFAYALGPVVSVLVSREPDITLKYNVIRQAFTFTFVISLCLAGLGLIAYPLWLKYIVVDDGVVMLAKQGLFWMTISIPTRMLVFISSMCLFACGEGRRVSYIYTVTILANALLDWILIYKLDYGFVGAYIATNFVSLIELFWLVYLICSITRAMPFSVFGKNWILSISKKIGSEWIRLASWQGEGLAILGILGARQEWLPIFSAFGVTNEFSTFLFMPLIALMRTVSMQVAQVNPAKDILAAYTQTLRVAAIALPISTLVGLVLATKGHFLGQSLYHLSDIRLEWWKAFCVIIGLSLPFFVIAFLQRGYLQSCDQFDTLARLDIVLAWCFFIPCFWLTLMTESPWLVFLCFTARTLIFSLFVWLYTHDLKLTQYKRFGRLTNFLQEQLVNRLFKHS